MLSFGLCCWLLHCIYNLLIRSLLLYTSVSGGRLECTMQNIADNYFNTYSSRCYNDVEGISNIFLLDLTSRIFFPFTFNYSNSILIYLWADQLDTFIVYNERRRVTSSAKRKRRHGDKCLHQVWSSDSLLSVYFTSILGRLNKVIFELPLWWFQAQYGPYCLFRNTKTYLVLIALYSEVCTFSPRILGWWSLRSYHYLSILLLHDQWWLH